MRRTSRKTRLPSPRSVAVFLPTQHPSDETQMASSPRIKTADRQAVLKKLLPLLKKQYSKITIPELNRPVMETMLYAVCLEDSTVEQADAAFGRFRAMFPDLNEARVSSISEMEPAFADLDAKDWRSFRTRAVLQYVFDKTYNFEFESLRKKTLELATKQLAKIKHITPFVRTYTLQQVIGAHVIPVDPASGRFLTWLGLATPGQSLDELGESLKSIVRKAEAHQFSFSIRCAAADSRIKVAFDHDKYPVPEDGFDANTAIDRLTLLFKNGPAAIKVPDAEAAHKAAKKKVVEAKPPAAKTAAPAKKAPAKKAAAKPAAAKAAPAKPKAAPKKTKT